MFKTTHLKPRRTHHLSSSPDRGRETSSRKAQRLTPTSWPLTLLTFHLKVDQGHSPARSLRRICSQVRLCYVSESWNKNKIYILDLSFILSFFLHACWRFAKQVSTSQDDKSDKQHNGVRACVCAASTWHRSTSHQRHTLGTLHQTGRDVDSADQTRIHSNKVGENTVTQSVIMGLYR